MGSSCPNGRGKNIGRKPLDTMPSSCYNTAMINKLNLDTCQFESDRPKNNPGAVAHGAGWGTQLMAQLREADALDMDTMTLLVEDRLTQESIQDVCEWLQGIVDREVGL